MEDFTLNIPTVLHLGENSTAKVIGMMADKGFKKCLMHYGGGSIKRNGAYDDAVAALKENNIDFHEFGDQKPNPRHSIALAAMKAYLAENCDCILAIGGGSIIDSAKYIALGSKLLEKHGQDTNVWAAIFDGEGPVVNEAAPLFALQTISATGSEGNMGGVISDDVELKKFPFGNPAAFPIASGLNPHYQSTLPPFQTASGALDMISHMFEAYHDLGRNTGVLPIAQMAMIEGLIEAVRVRVPELLQDPKNIYARKDVMWAGFNGLNYLLHAGTANNGDWTIHSMEHGLSAVTDVTHGIGLAVLHPGLWRWMEKHADTLTEGQKLMVERMKRVIFNGAKDMEEVVQQWRDLLKNWNMPTTLKELLELQYAEEYKTKTMEEWIDIVTDNVMQRSFGSFRQWTRDEIHEIFTLSCQ